MHRTTRLRDYLLVACLCFMFVWQMPAAQAAVLRASAPAAGEGVQWIFLDEGKPGAPVPQGSWVATAGPAPTEIAARFTLSSTMQGLALHLASPDLNGIRLVDLNTLDYCTRLVQGNRPDTVMLELSVDVDVTDADDSWQGRLVYVPAYNGAVVQGEWQCWKTLGGKWWATAGLLGDIAPADSPQPLGVLIARYPNLGIHADVSPVVLKAGEGWGPFVGEVGPVMVGRGDARTIYAFGEPDRPDQPWAPVVMQQPAAPATAPTPTPVPVRVDADDDRDQDKDQDKEQKEKKDKEKDKDKDEDKKKDKDKDKKDKPDKPAKAQGNAQNDDRHTLVDACRADGWSSLGFRNQGQCVAYYNHAANRSRD